MVVTPVSRRLITGIKFMPDELTKSRRILVSVQETVCRLDVFLSQKFPSFSRAQIQKQIKLGKVWLNGRNVKAHHLISPGDEIVIELPAPVSPGVEPENIPLEILYEDEHILVINKPTGIITHPASGVYSGTLVNALLYHTRNLSQIGGELRPGIVHRLDKDTSGVMVVAKTNDAHRNLVAQMQSRMVKKKYLALVRGKVLLEEGEIVAPVGRHLRNRKKMAVRGGKGRLAITRYRVRERFTGYTLLEVIPETGRTHQIRVHLAFLGYPVVGDRVYGGTKEGKSPRINLSRQALHAQILGFKHPATGEYVEFQAPLPADLSAAIEILAGISNKEQLNDEGKEG